jgi:hypothetical protein
VSDRLLQAHPDAISGVPTTLRTDNCFRKLTGPLLHRDPPGRRSVYRGGQTGSNGNWLRKKASRASRHHSTVSVTLEIHLARHQQNIPCDRIALDRCFTPGVFRVPCVPRLFPADLRR